MTNDQRLRFIEAYAADVLPAHCCPELFKGSALDALENGARLMAAIDAALVASDCRAPASDGGMTNVQFLACCLICLFPLALTLTH